MSAPTTRVWGTIIHPIQYLVLNVGVNSDLSTPTVPTLAAALVEALGMSAPTTRELGDQSPGFGSSRADHMYSMGISNWRLIL